MKRVFFNWTLIGASCDRRETKKQSLKFTPHRRPLHLPSLSVYARGEKRIIITSV